jgi:hypothetical protein
MVKLRLPGRSFLDTTDVEGDGVVGTGEEADDKGVKGVAGVDISVNGEEGVDEDGVEGRPLLAGRMARVRKADTMLLRAEHA